MTIHNSLRYYRNKKNLTQQQVAHRLGLKDNTLISRWENGVSTPTLSNLLKLSAVYRVSLSSLVHRVVKQDQEVSQDEQQVLL